MPDTDPCEICSHDAETIPDGGADLVHQRCPRCGEFKLSGSGQSVIRHVPRAGKVMLSGWVRDQNLLGEIPMLSSDQLGQIAALPLPGIMERANRLLTFAVKDQSRLGERFNCHRPELRAITYSDQQTDVEFLSRWLVKAGFFENANAPSEYFISPEGILRVEELQGHQSASAQGFVAMWFDNSMREPYENGFAIGIREAGYNPLRVDGVEHVGKIDDEIIRQIRQSRFVVADFTEHRGGVDLNITSSKPRWQVKRTGNIKLSVAPDATLAADTIYMFGVSLDEAVGVGGGFFYRNGAYDQVSAADTFDSTYAGGGDGVAASRLFQIAARGNGADAFPSGARLYIALGYDRAISKAEMDQIWDHYRGRFGL